MAAVSVLMAEARRDNGLSLGAYLRARRAWEITLDSLSALNIMEDIIFRSKYRIVSGLGSVGAPLLLVHINGRRHAVGGFVTFGRSNWIYGSGVTEEVAQAVARDSVDFLGGHDYAGDHREDLSRLPATPDLMAQIGDSYRVSEWPRI